MKNVRKAAFEIVTKVLGGNGYSNLLLNQMIKSKEIDPVDVSLLTEIVYGTIQNKITLDYYLKDFIDMKKTKGWVKNILRISLYQMHFLDKIPNHAILNEAVTLAKDRGGKNSGNFVNAVLRNISRKGLKSLDDIKDQTERLSIQTSHPRWLVSLWLEQYGLDTTTKLCNANNSRPSIHCRLNLTKDDSNSLIKKLEDQEIEVSRHPFIEEGVKIIKGNIIGTSLYTDGYLTIQDFSSMLVAKILDPSESDDVLDTCAAPGGKTTHIAELMSNSGSVSACDIYDHKIKLIDEHVDRLGLKQIKTYKQDARELTKEFKAGTFDRVLIDAPCSGLGVIKRKPEIKYHKSRKDLSQIVKLQKEIIDDAVKLLKPGGRLVYSTCTINKRENEDIVNYILKNNSELSLYSEPFKQFGLDSDGTLQILDNDLGADLFFIACFRKQV
ncbi:16S rRNA (cytosine(967)-C(5))-methyltransferase RsmB [Haloplasma contractile]|uniref:16S rRNA (cytosine(967)-C(5))-methyltransferase n=1 Tax=Haloplasma contractile SSD-17B TaxID=1033810 RepID=U2FQZ3_9MOLU|nr:16S rRNA (cytosine(967)-C(5))-methyltransferase RsmB [Haloplasma contractile]ERJ13424.1 Ribosomal RNA small subunit methyltransferase B protein [Haloplasma contractile SSD-17B]